MGEFDEQAEQEQEEMGLTDTNFDLEDEYKEDPLAPQGTYNGVVKNVEWVSKLNAIVWTVVAVQNPGITLLDEETPIDGTEYQFKNWVPKIGDEKLRSSNGKSNKRQTKINMLKKFAEIMDIDMNTQTAVADALENGTWIGISVIMGVGINTYKGNTNNQIDNMARAEEAFDLPEYNGDSPDDDMPF